MKNTSSVVFDQQNKIQKKYTAVLKETVEKPSARKRSIEEVKTKAPEAVPTKSCKRAVRFEGVGAPDVSKMRIPIYVDGTQDSQSDSSTSAIVISSGQSSSEDSGATVLIGGSVTSSPSTVLISSSNSTNGNMSPIMYNRSSSPIIVSDGESSQVSSVSDFSTLTASTNGTFDSAHDTSMIDHNYAVQGGSNNSPLQENGPGSSPVAGSQMSGQSGRAKITMDDLKPDVSYNEFEKRVNKTSAPKKKSPKKKPVKRKILQDVQAEKKDKTVKKKKTNK